MIYYAVPMCRSVVDEGTRLAVNDIRWYSESDYECTMSGSSALSKSPAPKTDAESVFYIQDRGERFL